MDMDDRRFVVGKVQVTSNGGSTHPEHSSPEGTRPAVNSDNDCSATSEEKSDIRTDTEQHTRLLAGLDVSSTRVDSIQCVLSVSPTASDTDDSSLIVCPIEVCPNSDDLNKSANQETPTTDAAHSSVVIELEVSSPENAKESERCKNASPQNTISIAEQVSYDATAELDSTIPLGPLCEELEYNELAGIFVENILDEQRKLSYVICPPSDCKTTVDYVYPLFKYNCLSSTSSRTDNLGEEFNDFESLKVEYYMLIFG